MKLASTVSHVPQVQMWAPPAVRLLYSTIGPTVWFDLLIQASRVIGPATLSEALAGADANAVEPSRLMAASPLVAPGTPSTTPPLQVAGLPCPLASASVVLTV